MQDQNGERLRAIEWLERHMKDEREEHLVRLAFLMGARTALAHGPISDGIEMADTFAAAARAFVRIVRTEALRRDDFQEALDSHITSDEGGLFDPA